MTRPMWRWRRDSTRRCSRPMDASLALRAAAARSRSSRECRLAPSEVGGVEDRVGVALLGQEALALGRELLVVGVAGDDRVEVGLAAVCLGARPPAEPLRLLLAAAERAGDLHGHRGLGQV